jgi:hypothetical protein
MMDEGRKRVLLIAAAIRRAEQILAEIDRRWPGTTLLTCADDMCAEWVGRFQR